MVRSRGTNPIFTTYEENLRGQIRALPVNQPPAPWSEPVVVQVGGLIAIAVGHAGLSHGELVLIVSRSGRSLVAADGTRLTRDRSEDFDTWLDTSHLTVLGIGALASQSLAISGIDGGGLPTTTRDGWSVQHVYLDWPRELVVLLPPFRPGSLATSHFSGGIVIDSNPASAICATGFSPSGSLLLSATASELWMWHR